MSQILLASDQKCRIIFSQPFDLIAYHVATYMAKNRGESVGETIGYQTFTKHCTSMNTVLTFCSHEILLKNLMSINDTVMLNSITHVVLVNKSD